MISRGGTRPRLVDFSGLAREFIAEFNKVERKHGVFASIEMLEGLLIFPDLHAKWSPASMKLVREHEVFQSIETLEGLLIFPDLHAKWSPDSMKSGKNTAFSHQSKRLTRSATEKSTSP